MARLKTKQLETMGGPSEAAKIRKSRSSIKMHPEICRVNFSYNLIWIIEEPSVLSHAA